MFLFIHVADFLPEWKDLLTNIIIKVSSANGEADDTVLDNWKQLFDKLNSDYDKEVFCYLGGATLLLSAVATMNGNYTLKAVITMLILSSTELSLTYCCSYGIIPTLINILLLNIEQISEIVSGTLAAIACIERLVPELVRNRLIEISLNLLATCENPSLCNSLIMLIWDLSEHFDEHKRIVTENNGIETLVDKLKLESPEIRCYIVGALWILAPYSIIINIYLY